MVEAGEESVMQIISGVHQNILLPAQNILFYFRQVYSYVFFILLGLGILDLSIITIITLSSLCCLEGIIAFSENSTTAFVIDTDLFIYIIMLYSTRYIIRYHGEQRKEKY